MQFQLINHDYVSGISKKDGKPYAFNSIQGIFQRSNGKMVAGKIALFSEKMTDLVVGATYETIDDIKLVGENISVSFSGVRRVVKES